MTMNEKDGIQYSRYRRPDQYYIDLIDRGTIEELKAKEKAEQEELAGVEDPEKLWEIVLGHSMAYNSFRNSGILRARERKHFIEEMMRKDERMDRLIEKTPAPKGIRCSTCNALMNVCNHFFDVAEIPILFVFDCPDGHMPRRAIYPGGREYFFPKRKCRECGFEITEKTEKQMTKLVTTSSCTMCGKSWQEELDLQIKEKVEIPITEEDRNKYCLDFKDRKTFMEDMESLANLFIEIDADVAIKNEMETSGANKIEKLTIPELESRLVKASETGGFIKFQLEKPEMKQYVRVPFTVQDPSKRDEKESVKVFMRMIKKELFSANWRLVGDVTYRLGYLSGGLKAYERDEDLIKLAEEIKKSNVKEGSGKKREGR